MPTRLVPFEKDLSDVSPDDLKLLREVHEGWYVEYKSILSTPRNLAKSLSSFANQLGGWIFYGISEDRNTHVAESFPGIPISDIPNALESLRNASKDLINPDVFFDSKVFEGPINSIDLVEGRSIIVVQVPQGADCPYFHVNGRIYRRVADSSDPKPETDRTRLDVLTERGNQARSQLIERVTDCPDVSEAEKNNCYIHVSITSDPYENMGHNYTLGFSKFCDTMRQGMIPFDNVYSNSGGYVARQIANNEPYYRVFTWEFSRNCHSFVTIPVSLFRSSVPDSGLPENSIFARFLTTLKETGIEENCRILDLNQVLVAMTAITVRHRSLAGHANVNGPFYVKAYLENIWRVVPFVDLSVYLKHVSEFGLPIVQASDEVVPPGTSLDSFVLLPERDALDSEYWSDSKEIAFHVVDSFQITKYIFEAFGLPRHLFNQESITELFLRSYTQTKTRK